MSEPAAVMSAPSECAAPSERLARETARLGRALADVIERVPLEMQPAMHGGHEFLLAMAEAHAVDGPRAHHADHERLHPIDRVAALYSLSAVEVDLLLLAGMPEEHEGYGSVLRALHPRNESRPTIGLAAQMLCIDDGERALLREMLERGALSHAGMISLGGDAPFWERSIVPADALWPALLGLEVWPSWLTHAPASRDTAGLDEWLALDGTSRAAAALADGTPRLIVVTADSEDVAIGRAAALAAHARLGAERLVLPPAMGESAEDVAGVHCALRGVLPILTIARAESGTSHQMSAMARFPGPVVVAARTGHAVIHGDRPVIAVHATRLSTAAQQRAWARALPELSGASAVLAARYNLEPASVHAVARDVRSIAALHDRGISVDDVGDSVRTRSNVMLAGGVSLVTPVASWEDLVLPPDTMRQLREIMGRLVHQGRVLGEWGFLHRRRGARGVRALFAGPSGTGKTLSAEVLAAALGVDLLVVDIARVVSKWIGETEKNLADVFDTAERTQAVLLFDEADALFGKRTEVKDAHDRYANLETAYLLTRLERFDGLAILATNLRQHIDPAFTRRLEFVLDFSEPSSAERETLWRCHIPARAPLAPDVRLSELAALYPIVGGLIRNAAVAAGFLATADDAPITRDHLVRAVRREYEKAGRAFPGAPAGSDSH